MSHPLTTSTDVIRHAIAEQVRRIGGNEADIDDIAFAASYAVMCFGFAATESI
ncbi:hypothetical protein FHT40_001475 [Mycolicibacterium sp. BK556]|uniref:hypothetical protein n=1 Tax=Mycobacteriaceae TaxID=1762 RepID=UPI0010D13A14|nr:MULTISPECIES: hypothetical protein [Mycobacteriaceae]MBB3601842.1 hypothetical protein [Mycolicibacterium sp. BK556]MBB3631594.1 hypothetical protein [Mycolicibacterium sp. BK607]MBB3749598.1 hypothetical protein [Mycolicibacterium sp. BK634]TDO14185.1 hypothetical protein EV580_2309 [Mycobacterium sp. BK086]